MDVPLQEVAHVSSSAFELEMPQEQDRLSQSVGPKDSLHRTFRMLILGAFAVVVIVIGVSAFQGKSMTKGAKDHVASKVTTAVADYYKGVDTTLTGPALKQALHELISQHTVVSYDGVWLAFDTTDEAGDCADGTLVDVYSSKCWTEHEEQCGNYKAEGDCYNREHGWPKSWWGGFADGKGAQTDLFHLYPTDGYVNGLRGNLPLGQVTEVSYTSTNGAKVGTCSNADAPAGKCFEPPDTFKGDFARSYFYVSVAYAGLFECCDDVGVNGADIKPWMEAVLRSWALVDPVSAKELQRNEQVYALQKNRNPFIDFPELMEQMSDF